MTKKTFTLLELVIVLLIIGALATLSIEQYMDSQVLTKMRIFESNVNEIAKALSVYKSNSILYGNQTNSYPTSLVDSQFKALFKQEPKNPYTSKPMLSDNPADSGIQYVSDGTSYKLCIVQRDVDDVNNNGVVDEPLSNLLAINKNIQLGDAVDFTRNSPAAMPDDTTFVPDNTPRFVNNDGLLVEDESVNKIVTEGAWNNDWSNWNHWTAGNYWKTATQFYDPTISATVFQGTASTYTYFFDYYPYTLTASKTKYSFSIYLKTSATLNKTIRAYFLDKSTGIAIGESFKTVTLTPSWQKFSWQLTASKATATSQLSNVGIGIGPFEYVDGIVFYAAKPQFEEQDYASTWMGPEGQRSRDNVQTSLSGKIDMTKPWTIETWALPNPEKILTNPSRVDCNSRAVLWQIGNYHKPNQLSITLWKYYPKQIQITFFDNLESHSFSQTLDLPSDYDPNTPIYTAVSYDGNGNYRMYLGSTTFATTATFNFVNNYQPADRFWIGSYDWAKGAWAGPILDMRISNVVRSEQELRTNWTNQWPLPIDLNTVYKLSFDGTLNSQVGTEMNCVFGN